MKKIVYFIMAHSDPDLLTDTVRLFYNDDDFFIIHIDKKSLPALKTSAALLSQKFKNIFILNEQYVSWGGASQVQIQIRAIDLALNELSNWSHFVPISEQHAPLKAAKDVKLFLENKISYINWTNVQNMPPEIQSNVSQRLRFNYKELPGTGSFVGGDENPSYQVKDLKHGSNWTILSVEACQLILQMSNLEITNRLLMSLQPDEIFMQTLLVGATEVKNINTTYVAWPHLTGRKNMTFDIATYQKAQQMNYLFIRKREKFLPKEIEMQLDDICFLNREKFQKYLQGPAYPSVLSEVSSTTNLVAESIIKKLTQIDIDITIEKPVNKIASVYLLLKSFRTLDNLRLYIISSDNINFKVGIVWITKHIDPDVIKVNGYKTTLIKVRAPHLFRTREIVISQNDFGFIKIDDRYDGTTRLVTAVKEYLKVLESFDSLPF
ncbi:beta-1,6-N-acetylglucosaminyltransferase [Acidocella sp.]|uniref:beta-1,6-N-acetylglucosaminyltransferase n=1 Tax=Acidocella sp. TaxID=50710 RepID=UPI002607918B|nr:beta-1,6-N-acetylglucosaminyltransferase [Acidocella sp.]